ncbi:hypothetical protein FEF65_02890 [Mariprofundus erugo]|uniref:Uncharacterized protein n=1 Tax=Mariprofundus erugo TaxID=2528639 RepID=A0A5R9GQY0_9PROT|nr:hypothetical protein [Mariprofundus erugo]TLS68666.1 hypothetical protein FEF65_02890 [Mariprofundus erugo]
MSLTLGFVMRFDSYPPAVAVQPLVSGLQPAQAQLREPVIDVQPVSKSSDASADGSGLRNDLRGGHAYQDFASSQPLTYTRRGEGAFSPFSASGRTVDLFA